MPIATPTELRTAVARLEANLQAAHDLIDSGDGDALDQMDRAARRAARIENVLLLPMPDDRDGQDLELMAELDADRAVKMVWVRGAVGPRIIAHPVAPGTGAWWWAEQAVAVVVKPSAS